MKRIIYTLLTIMLTTGAWAQNVAKIGETEYETLADAVAAVPTDGTETTIKMLSDVELAAAVNIALGKNVVLDLNGHNITSTTTAISNKGNLEVTGTGNITVTGTSKTVYGISNSGGAALTNRAHLVVGQNVTITAPCTAVYTSYAYTTINGTLANTQAETSSNIYSTLRQSNGSEVIVATTAKVTGQVNAIYGNYGTVEVNSTNVGKIYADGSATQGLKIKKTAAVESLNVYGHAECSDVADYYVAAKAISGCTGTVKLLSDINAALAVSAGKTVTLDLNGHKVTAENYAIQVQGNLTITGEGTLQSTGMGSSTSVQAAAYVLKDGKLTIESGNYIAGFEGEEGNPAVYVRDNAVVEIKDGDFVGGSKYLLNKLDASQATSTIEVTGGTFHNNFNPADNIAEGEHTNFVASDYKSVDNGDGTYSVVPREYVAQINETKYETLAEAITSATEGQTITLLADVVENVVIPAGKNITLDLGGKTLNGKQIANTPTIKNLGTLTVKNGNVRRSDEGSANWYVLENEGTIILDEGLNVEGSTGSSLIRNNAATAQMTFNAGTYTQTGAFVVVKNDLGTVEINGGTFSTTDSKNVLNNWDQMTINGGTFTGGILNGAYDTDNNKLIINDGTFNTAKISTYIGNGKTTCPIEIKGGSFTNADMIYAATGEDNAQVIVSGGTFANAVPEKYCADGFIPEENGDGTYGVKEGSYIARIGEQGYETLDDAITTANGAGKDVTITLLADATATVEPATNVTINADGKVVTLPTFNVTDGSDLAYAKVTNATDNTYKVTTATYTRAMPTGTTWGTVCLPFTLKSNDAIKLYQVASISGSTMTVTEITEDVQPGTPVIFKTTGTVASFTTTEASVSNVAPATTGTLIGTYSTITLNSDLGSIYFINGDKFHQAKASLTVPAYRAYINYTTTGAKPSILTMSIGDNEATAVENIAAEDMTITSIYNANGQLLAAPQKGLNIINRADGKTVKLIIK